MRITPQPPLTRDRRAIDDPARAITFDSTLRVLGLGICAAILCGTRKGGSQFVAVAATGRAHVRDVRLGLE